MPKLNTCLSYELTANTLDHEEEFNKFFSGLTEFLKRKLKKIEVKGKFSYEQYTCGQLHDRWNLNWKPWQRLWQYCEGTGLDPFAARDAIEKRLGVKLECECQIIDNEVGNRRKALANTFGADLGERGRDWDFF